MSSRIIVKNLPKYLTQDRFKAHFAQRGQVTDCKLVTTPDGVFRRFGFIGYKSEAEAEAAVAFFNGSYLDTCRLVVELAQVPQYLLLPFY